MTERIVWERPFCRIISFAATLKRRQGPAQAPDRRPDVRALRHSPARNGRELLPTHQVHITDWADARTVPLIEGRFDLDDYIDYLNEIFRALGPDSPCRGRVPAGRPGDRRGRP